MGRFEEFDMCFKYFKEYIELVFDLFLENLKDENCWMKRYVRVKEIWLNWDYF